MNKQALWQTVKPLAPYTWLLGLWAWLFAKLYFIGQNIPTVVAVLLTVMLATVFTIIAALAQLAVTEAVRSVWSTYQCNVREQERKASLEGDDCINEHR